MHTEPIEQNGTQAGNIVAKPWRIKAALLWLVISVSTRLVCPWVYFDSSVKMQIGMGLDLLVLLRIIVGSLFGKTGPGWIVYAILPLWLLPILNLIVVLWK
jgi:hypothetical protein